MSLKLGTGFFLFTRVITQADYVFVSNAGNGTIERFDPGGNETIFASGLNSPAGLAFDAAGNLYVANSGAGTILQFDSGGNASVFASGLNNPRDIAFDPSGNLYVAGRNDGTITKYGAGRSQTLFANGVGFDSDDAYIATDATGNVYANTRHSLIAFDSGGNLTVIDSTLGYEEGMAVDLAGNLYAAQQNGNFIHCIRGAGSLNTSVENYPYPYNDSFVATSTSSPLDLAFDSAGNLYATFYALASSAADQNPPSLYGVILKFGVDGTDAILATDTGGQYIAIQPVPEARVSTMVLLGGGLLVGHRWWRRRQSATFRL